MRLRGHDAASWAAIIAAAAAVLVTCLVPAVQIAVEASIGAGFEQRSFRYDRTLTLAADAGWPGSLAAVAAAGLLGIGMAAVFLGSRPGLVVAAFVLATALGVLVFDMEDRRLYWAGDRGVVGYDEPTGGPLLQPALDDLKAEARSSPEAREPGWALSGENYFSSRGLGPWRVFLWSALALLWLAGYRLARLACGRWASLAIVAGATVAVAAWLVLRGFSRLQ